MRPPSLARRSAHSLDSCRLSSQPSVVRCAPGPVREGGGAMIEIRCRTEGRATVLELVGELCVVTAPAVAAAIDTALEAGGTDVVLDLAEVTLFGSTAANLVIDAAGRVAA